MFTVAKCLKCDNTISVALDSNMRRVGNPWCETCRPRVDPEGRLIRAAQDVMRAQRAKGIKKYRSTLEDQQGYTIGGMIDMTAEELADGSVYVQKVREMYHSLLDELDAVLGHPDGNIGADFARKIIKRERGNV